MDMDFNGSKKSKVKVIRPLSATEPKELPGFRGGSELPEHGTAEPITDKELAEAFGGEVDTPLDPTDLTLDREKSATATIIEENRVVESKKKKSKKRLIILLILLGIILLGGGGYFAYKKFLDKPTESTTQSTTTKPVTAKKVEPTTAPAPITGVDVSLEAAKKAVTAVMIENSVDARPQSGLYDADMVVEAIAEGGITRFVALFQQGAPASIGPIRSARPYYVEIAKTFDAAYVHAGGSPDALQLVSDMGIKDMSAFEQNGTYERVDFRAAPHNLYSSTGKLDARRTELGYTTSTFTQWKHKKDTPQTPTAQAIHFKLSSADFNADFTYDQTTNSYTRNVGGDPHLDASAGKQIQPKVVVGLVTSKGQDGQYSTYKLTGSGEGKIFQDGIVSAATWTKDSSSSQFIFKDKNGLEFAFNKGQVWMTLLGSTSEITSE